MREEPNKKDASGEFSDEVHIVEEERLDQKLGKEENTVLQPEKEVVKAEIEKELSSLNTNAGITNKPEGIPSGQKEKTVGYVDSVVQPIRTFKQDVASAMQQQKTSISSVVAAEQNRRARNTQVQVPNKPLPWKKILLLTGSLVLIVGGGLLLGGLFFFRGSETGTATGTTKPPALVFVNDEIEVSIQDENARVLKNKLAVARESVQLSLGSLAELFLTKSDQADGKTFVTAGEFMELIGANISPSFLRTLDPRFLLGVHIFDGNQPIVLFPVTSFEQAFAGMLEWERTMADDLSPFFPIPPQPAPIGTSTPATKEVFVDMVIRNHDVRALERNGKIVLLYLFPSRRTLIITTNEHSMAELLNRMSNTAGR